MNSTYKLVSEGRIGYVGTTTKSLDHRLKQHLTDSRRQDRRSHLIYWLRSLAQPPAIEIIERVSFDAREASERYWISIARDYGCNIVNSTDGGDGVINPSAEAREKMGVPHRGKPGNPKAIAAMKAANTGRQRTPEHLENNAAANRGKKRTPEQIERMAAALRGKKHTPEQRAARSLRQKGVPPSSATLAASRAVLTGKPLSLEHRAKLCISQQRRWARRRGES